MKNLSFYQTKFNCTTKDDVFDFFIATLKPSNTIWSYFVNWDKVFFKTEEIQESLNKLSYLIGHSQFDQEFRFLLKDHPNIARIIPTLGVRDGNDTKKFQILLDCKSKNLKYEKYDFSKSVVSDEDIEKYLTFVKKTGIKNLLVNKKIKNLTDYMIGVEAGLDSNGRKNRSGSTMESIVEFFIKEVCQKNGFKFLKEVNVQKIEKELGYKVLNDKVSHRYDFVIDNGKELFILETNFYGRGGSKLKATAGEYKNLANHLKKQKYKLLWITDGSGWKTTEKSLRETFDHNDYIFNLKMLESNILEFVLKL